MINDRIGPLLTRRAFAWPGDAEITTDRENEMIGWRSLEGSMLETAGYIRFERAPGGGGTLVRVAVEYIPPSGRVGGAIASILGKNPGTHLDQALRCSGKKWKRAKLRERKLTVIIVH